MGVGDGLEEVVVDPFEAFATCRDEDGPPTLVEVGLACTPPVVDEYEPDGLLSVLRKSKRAGGAAEEEEEAEDGANAAAVEAP